MECQEARERLHDLRRQRLDPHLEREVRRHLETCADCPGFAEGEELLDQLLGERLPRAPVPPDLRRRLEALARGGAEAPARGQGAPVRARRRGAAADWTWLAGGALAACLLAAAGALLLWRPGGEARSLDRLAQEAVSDHLRVLVSARPREVESSSTHQVKPWFAGRLDFAPAVPPDGGQLTLLGGAVGYFLDRKAAVISYAWGRHAVTLLAVPAGGLDWPGPDRAGGGGPPRVVAARGFRAAFWRAGDLGYAAVSDVAAGEFGPLAERMAGATAIAP